MPEPIDVTQAVRVPAAALTMRAVRASGPDGQNVNKVSSRVELMVERALVVPKRRGATRPHAGAREARIRDEKVVSRTKSQRTRTRPDED